MNKEEAAVILGKGTEAPYSGQYEKFSAAGTYVCRRCQTPLYRSDDKFDAHCGWPSFDQELPSKVKRLPDADGRRTEIECALCGAHLGHVFTGERLTDKDTRHCVNSVSLHFIPAAKASKIETAVFGGGCFWCGEAVFLRLRGVVSVLSGYSGGATANPTYEKVCGGTTGHAETVKVEFDPSVIPYEALLEVFFALHDPTTLNRQGNDVGTQYRSVIFFSSASQQAAAESYRKKLSDSGQYAAPIVTAIEPLKNFYPAEAEHFDYYAKNGRQPYCQLVISPKIKKIEEKFARLINKIPQ